MEVKVVGLMHSFGCRKPGEQRHYNHDAFLDTSRPFKVPAQHCCGHHSDEIQKVLRALNMEPTPRLHLFCQRTRSFHVLFEKDVLLKEIENNECQSYDERPLRE